MNSLLTWFREGDIGNYSVMCLCRLIGLELAFHFNVLEEHLLLGLYNDCDPKLTGFQCPQQFEGPCDC